MTFEPPTDLPFTAPACIVIKLHSGATLYRCFEDREEAKDAWSSGLRLDPGEEAYLFIDGILLADCAS